MITADELASLAHISDSEILRDIADTQAEIDERELQIKFLDKKIANAGQGTIEARMPNFRRAAAISGITKRNRFIAYCTELLEARKE